MITAGVPQESSNLFAHLMTKQIIFLLVLQIAKEVHSENTPNIIM